MKKYHFCILILLILISNSCRDESSSLGDKWLESRFKNVYTDTCTVKISTMYFDSINTSASEVALIGYYEDKNWGKIKASSFIEYKVAHFEPDENAEYQFDSLTITFLSNNDYLGDTLQSMKIQLYKLTENIEMFDNGYLFNNSSVSYSNTPFAEINFKLYPNESEETEIRLPDELGLEWLNMLVERRDEFDSQDNFRTFFPGIAFIPDENSTHQIGDFLLNDSSMYITMYYQRIKEYAYEQTLKFEASESYNFNRSEYDRSGTPLEKVNSENNEVLSSETNNQTYIQGMCGLYTKIEFPHLNNLLMEGEMVSIESAMLYLYPVRGSYSGDIPLSSSLTLYTADESNVTSSEVKDAMGSSVQTGNLSVDDLFHKDTRYSFDITSFLQDNLGKIGINKQNLQLSVPDDKINSSYNSVLLGDMEHSESQMKLSIIYKVYMANN